LSTIAQRGTGHILELKRTSFGMTLAMGYVVFVYSRFQGRADVNAEL